MTPADMAVLGNDPASSCSASEHGLLSELEETVTALYDRHLATTKEWFPHEFIPRDADVDDLPRPVRSALLINLLTEDQLPYYTSELERRLGKASVWAQWARRWTAEEQRHSIVIREWIHATRALDPYSLERARMEAVQEGVADHGASLRHALIYVAVQELATRVAHGNTASAIADAAGRRMLRRVASDENLHFIFYRDLVAEMLLRDPSVGMIALSDVVRTFKMPGADMPSFRRHAFVIAQADIYSWSIHVNQVLIPLMRNWGVEELGPLTGDAARAREQLVAYVQRLTRIGERQQARAPRTGTRADASV